MQYALPREADKIENLHGLGLLEKNHLILHGNKLRILGTQDAVTCCISEKPATYSNVEPWAISEEAANSSLM